METALHHWAEKVFSFMTPLHTQIRFFLRGLDLSPFDEKKHILLIMQYYSIEWPYKSCLWCSTSVFAFLCSWIMWSISIPILFLTLVLNLWELKSNLHSLSVPPTLTIETFKAITLDWFALFSWKKLLGFEFPPSNKH